MVHNIFSKSDVDVHMGQKFRFKKLTEIMQHMEAHINANCKRVNDFSRRAKAMQDSINDAVAKLEEHKRSIA